MSVSKVYGVRLELEVKNILWVDAEVSLFLSVLWLMDQEWDVG